MSPPDCVSIWIEPSRSLTRRAPLTLSRMRLGSAPLLTIKSYRGHCGLTTTSIPGQTSRSRTLPNIAMPLRHREGSFPRRMLARPSIGVSASWRRARGGRFTEPPTGPSARTNGLRDITFAQVVAASWLRLSANATDSPSGTTTRRDATPMELQWRSDLKRLTGPGDMD